jgi:hypothetical protein
VTVMEIGRLTANRVEIRDEDDPQRIWSYREWENVLRKKADKWTDEELLEGDRRGFEDDANAMRLRKGDIEYLEIAMFLNVAQRHSYDYLREKDIDAFMPKVNGERSMRLLNAFLAAVPVHFSNEIQRDVFRQLLDYQLKDPTVSAIRVNTDTGMHEAVCETYSTNLRPEWTESYFMLLVSSNEDQIEPDFILLIPIPELNGHNFMLN